MTDTTESQRPDDDRENAVVREVRQVRARLWNESGGTAKGYIDMIRRQSRRRAAERAAREQEKKSA